MFLVLVAHKVAATIAASHLVNTGEIVINLRMTQSAAATVTANLISMAVNGNDVLCGVVWGGVIGAHGGFPVQIDALNNQ